MNLVQRLRDGNRRFLYGHLNRSNKNMKTWQFMVSRRKFLLLRVAIHV